MGQPATPSFPFQLFIVVCDIHTHITTITGKMKLIGSSFALLVAAAAVVVHGQEGPQQSLRATGRRLTTTTTTPSSDAAATAPSPSFVWRILQGLFVFSALFDETPAITTPTSPPA